MALDKAYEMMLIPIDDLPKEATEFLKYLSDKMGYCAEVCLTAFTYYNQAILNMPCNNEQYIIPDTEDGLKWFKNRGYCK